MTQERLKEIKYGIILQYILAKAKNIDNALLFTDEEQELYDEVIKLQARIDKAIEYIKNNKLCICKEDKGMIFTAFVDEELLNILQGEKNE